MNGSETPSPQAMDLVPVQALGLLSSVADLVLVLDAAGVIQEPPSASPVACAGKLAVRGLLAHAARQWQGRAWVDTFTRDSQPRAVEMLAEIHAKGFAGPRSMTHRTPAGVEVPVACTASELGRGGGILVVGRDLDRVAAMQTQLHETQQTMERDYHRMRQAESRYQLLFRLATRATLVVEAETLRIADANLAAGRLLGRSPSELLERPAAVCFDRRHRAELEDLLASARASGGFSETLTCLADGRTCVRVGATPYRSEQQTWLLLRVDRQGGESQRSHDAPKLAALMQEIPDAIVLTDASGSIVEVNPAFRQLVGIGDLRQALGRSLGDWLGRPGSELGTILSALEQDGPLRALPGWIRCDSGVWSEIELSAARLSTAAGPAIGFILRRAARGARDVAEGIGRQSVAGYDSSALVGRMPLSELIRDTTDLVERDFIAAALQRARGNRTTAAEILGLSRQSLYVKLRRHGLGADPVESAARPTVRMADSAVFSEESGLFRPYLPRVASGGIQK